MCSLSNERHKSGYIAAVSPFLSGVFVIHLHEEAEVAATDTAVGARKLSKKQEARCFFSSVRGSNRAFLENQRVSDVSLCECVCKS